MPYNILLCRARQNFKYQGLLMDSDLVEARTCSAPTLKPFSSDLNVHPLRPGLQIPTLTVSQLLPGYKQAETLSISCPRDY